LLKDRLPKLRRVIEQEVKTRLVRGLPTPLFLLSPSQGTELFVGQRNILPHDDDACLVAVDFNTGRRTIEEKVPQIAEQLRELPDKHVAVVVILDPDAHALEVIRIDIARVVGSTSLRDSIDSRKLDGLRNLLDNYTLTAVSEGSNRTILRASLRTAVEEFLSLLLQRPPSQTEVDDVLSALD
jgi:hypothetical protein